jgi:hypothetical protein
MLQSVVATTKFADKEQKMTEMNIKLLDRHFNLM